jgi:hypothetical protein
MWIGQALPLAHPLAKDLPFGVERVRAFREQLGSSSRRRVGCVPTHSARELHRNSA